MGLKINVGTVALLLLLALYAANAQSGVFDITKYGGKSNGDITQVLMYICMHALISTFIIIINCS